ncbi:MAG: hypothetical protein AB7I38_06320 [Dehalococcoidia bacterium]
MGKLLALLLILAVVALGFAFLYQPGNKRSRFSTFGRRVRTVAYAYVAAILISAILRLAFDWGS